MVFIWLNHHLVYLSVVLSHDYVLMQSLIILKFSRFLLRKPRHLCWFCIKSDRKCGVEGVRKVGTVGSPHQSEGHGLKTSLCHLLLFFLNQLWKKGKCFLQLLKLTSSKLFVQFHNLYTTLKKNSVNLMKIITIDLQKVLYNRKIYKANIPKQFIIN